MQSNAAVFVVLSAMHGDSKVLGFAIEIRDLGRLYNQHLMMFAKVELFLSVLDITTSLPKK